MQSDMEHRRQKRIRRRKIRQIKRRIASIVMAAAAIFVIFFVAHSILSKSNEEIVVKKTTIADIFKKYVSDEYAKRTKDISKVEIDNSGKNNNKNDDSKNSIGKIEDSADKEKIVNDKNDAKSSVEQTENNEDINKIVKDNDDSYYDSLDKYDVASYGTKYLIRVNRAANRVTIYQEDAEGMYGDPVISMTCSCGLDGETPLGEFSVTDNKWEWLGLVGDVYGQYVTQFYGDYLFHSVPYDYAENNTLLADEYTKLGENASHGCVRLCVRDTKWIYDNCEVGTPVIIYDDAEHPGPIEPQRLPDMKIFKDSVDNIWDPTDPDENNPWRDKLI